MNHTPFAVFLYNCLRRAGRGTNEKKHLYPLLFLGLTVLELFLYEFSKEKEAPENTLLNEYNIFMNFNGYEILKSTLGKNIYFLYMKMQLLILLV
mgnify:CR=1 FL=1